MSDRTSAEIFGEVFRILADHVELPGAKEAALKLWYMKQDNGYDFSNYQMESDGALRELGLLRGEDDYGPR